jgi:hypothetical protein
MVPSDSTIRARHRPRARSRREGDHCAGASRKGSFPFLGTSASATRRSLPRRYRCEPEPDTESTVVYRTAIDSGSGDDTSPTTHGTVLAMLAGAPANDWGTVGIAPHTIQMVSVRILEPGQATFPFSSYADAISICLSLRTKYNIRVINLSLGSADAPSSQNYEMVGNAIEEAENYGVAVVAAAGNDDGGPVGYPAAYPGVLSVGASDTQGGAFCSFSNRGEGLRLIAPGCDLDAADPTTGAPDFNYWQGTSESAAIAAAALDALFADRPNLSVQAGQEYITNADHGPLDIAQAFRNAGLQQIVTSGEAAEPRPVQTPAPTASSSGSQSPPPLEDTGSSSMSLTLAFPQPHARLHHTKHGNVLQLTGRPSEARTEVRYLGYPQHSRHLRLLKTLTGVFTNLTIPHTVQTIQVRYTDPYDIARTSQWITLKIPAGKPGHWRNP